MPATFTCFPAEGLSFKTYVSCVSQGMETEGKNEILFLLAKHTLILY